MPILRERKTWKRKPSTTPRGDQLTPEEQRNVVRALRALLAWYGSWPKVAEQLGYSPGTLKNMVGRGPVKPSPGAAIRAAQVAGKSVDDVLSGEWPAPGMCPMCGRG